MDFEIFRTLEKHEERVKHYYPNATILGTFLYGSQNYKIDTPESDVDTITILIPSLSDLIFEPPVSKEFIMPKGTYEHCVVKDIREIVKMWKKQSINFLEILFTDYSIINPVFQKDWDKLLEEREFIARMNLNQAINSTIGQAKHTYLQDKDKTDNKKQANALRLYYFLVDLITKPDLSYRDCITSHHEIIRKIKMGECKSPLKVDLLTSLESFEKGYGGIFLFNGETAGFVDSWLYDIINKNITLTKVEKR